MKKILLTIALIATMAQADNVVHYDQKGKAEKSTSKQKEKPKTGTSKPNHPSTEIYNTKK